jgi:hypothetical protein
MNGWTEFPCNIGMPGARLFRRGSIQAIVSKDDGSWHISVSHPLRYPKWDEIHQARYDLIPNEAYMVMILPPKEEYVNIHKNCFHLWEISKAAYEGRDLR